jgi:ribose 5-phosphate isomerase B
MKIAVGADHAGLERKDQILKYLTEKGHEILNFGTDSSTSCHYPEYAAKVAESVIKGEADRGILFCGTGIGMAIAANRFDGVRAANCNDLYSVKMSRLHNNSNILTVGARIIGEGLTEEIVDNFLLTPYEGGRHQLRIDMFDKRH